MKDKLLKVTAIPKIKHPHPATSNQEVGWDSDLVRITQPQYKPTWNYCKPSCAETKYASNYYTMTGKSPYSNKIATQTVKKQKNNSISLVMGRMVLESVENEHHFQKIGLAAVESCLAGLPDGFKLLVAIVGTESGTEVKWGIGPEEDSANKHSDKTILQYWQGK